MTHVLVPLAEGFEEIEAVTIIDILRRARLRVTVAGVGGDAVTGSHGIRVACDAPIEAVEPDGVDAVVLPGGATGSRNLAASDAVGRLLDEAAGAGKLVAAICAAPTVLAGRGLLDGRRATSHPNHAGEMEGCRYSEERVVTDGPFVTSRGAGTALEFAAELVGRFADPGTAEDILRSILYTER